MVKIKNIVSAYKTLGEIKTAKLEEAEIVKILKARKAMRPFAEEFDAFLKDVQEKFKPANWDELQQKIAQWQQDDKNTTLTNEEKIEINKVLARYQNSINSVINDEFEREVEISIETLKEESIVKLLTENNWELKKLDDIEIILCQETN